MTRLSWLILLTASGCLWAQDPNDIIRRSVAANNADWASIPQYAHHETDTEVKLNSDGSVRSKTTKTFDLLIIDGSEYEKLLAINGQALSPQQQKEEDNKLQAEIQRRRHESARERQRRIAKYQKERHRDHILMTELTRAFNFQLLGKQQANGFECYLLNATPRPGYTPPNAEAKVLTGMQGKLWIDTKGYHWVKVEAEVTKPVSTFVIANVRPGTKFEFDQRPVGGAWLPSHFSQSVNASVLGIHTIRSREDESYSDYRRLTPGTLQAKR